MERGTQVLSLLNCNTLPSSLYCGSSVWWGHSIWQFPLRVLNKLWYNPLCFWVWLSTSLCFVSPSTLFQIVTLRVHNVVVWLLSCVWLFATPWAVACQASLSITNSQTLLRLMSIEWVMPSNQLILCRPLLLPPSIFPSIRVFFSKSVLRIRWQSIGVSASVSVLPMNIQGWFPLGWTG